MPLAYLEGMGGSYFKITSKDISDKIFTEDIISFTYTEENYRTRTGSLSVYDPGHFYSKVLRFGAVLNIEFGYLKENEFFNPKIQQQNPTQLFGAGKRTGIKAYIQNPKGTAGSNGVVTYNCNFYGWEAMQSPKKVIHVNISRGDMIRKLMQDIGVINPIINFSSQNRILNADTQIPQTETSYRLLLRLAREWRVIFRISNDAKGLLTGIFISPDKIDLPSLPQQLSGAIGGDSIYLEYGSGEQNVLEYSWENHQGKSGSGDNVQIIRGADGKATFLRFVAKGDTIVAYKFKPEIVKKRLKAEGNFIKRLDKLKEWVSTNDFQKISWAFEPYKQSTAPQGLGYSLKCKMIGNPLMSAPLKVYFGNGFPVFFTPKKKKGHITNYLCNSVVHTISAQGYFMDLDIADAFTASGGSFVG